MREIDDKSEIFQIWFDPLSKSLQKEASYDDYSSDHFKVIELENKTKKIIKGDGSWKWIVRIFLLMNIILMKETIL